MTITEQLKSEIDKDIINLGACSIEEAMSIYNKYKNHIDGVKTIVTYYGLPINKLQKALEGFRLFGYTNSFSETNPTNVHIENKNENSNIIEIKITFKEVKDDIKNNPYLSDDMINEIVSKIDELESIEKKEETQKGKWKKVKPIFDWLSTQGAEIAVKIIPLVLKIISEAS